MDQLRSDKVKFVTGQDWAEKAETIRDMIPNAAPQVPLVNN